MDSYQGNTSEVLDGTDLVNGFLLNFLKKVEVENSLKAILNNRLAAEAFGEFLERNRGRFLETVGGEDNLMLDQSSLRVALTDTEEINVFFTSGPSKLLSAMYLFLPEFLRDIGFRMWREVEFQEITLSAEKWLVSSKITLPDLLCDKDHNGVPEASAKCSITSMNNYCTAEISDSRFISPVESDITTPIPLANSSSSLSEYDPLFNAMSRCDIYSLSQLLISGSWITFFMVAVEMLPIAVTVSLCNIETHTSAIIYANKEFETIAGGKHDIINENSSVFLQNSITLRLPHQGQQISSLIRASETPNTSRVIDLTSSRFSGEMFPNILGMKTLTDSSSDNKVKYMITMQHELQMDDSSSFWIKLIQDSLNILPNSM